MADVAGDLSTTASISVGAAVSGTLEVQGDHDWFAVTLTAGQAYDVLVHGLTLEDSYVTIRDSAGNILFSNDDINPGIVRDSEVKFTANYTGTYYIDVGGFQDSYAGTYQLSVKPYTPPPVWTYDQIADQLVSGFWGGDSHHFAVTQGGTITVDIHTLNQTEQTLARAALQTWTDIIGVNFREVLTGAQITFSDQEGQNGPIASTDANWSGGIISSANIQISSSWVTNYGSSLNSYSYQAYIHEIGHALGLGHAGNYNNTADYPYDALFANDAWSTSIMSYFSQTENTYFAGLGFTKNFAVTPMGADILAMQRLYGLSTTTRTGDTTYGYNSTAGGVYNASNYPSVAYTIFDSGGNDTIDYSGGVTAQTINLNQETFSNVNGYTGNLFIARGVVIENAIGGSGADTLTGNAAANLLKGGGGADTINGGAGDDTLTGGSGSDQLTGGLGNDMFKDTAAGLNGDKLIDFGPGDKVVISDANLATFTFSVSGTTLTYSGGSLTLGSAPSGTIVASAAAGGGVQLAISTSLPTLTHQAENDFNGDGFSDVLWRNDSGRVITFLGQANGSFVGNVNFDLNPGLDWHVQGTGDFNGDGRADLLWRSDNGTVVTLLGNANGSFTGNVNFNLNPGPDWHIQGTGDFNGDHRDDILWRSDNGTVVTLLGNENGSFTGNVSFNLNPGLDWHVQGTGDYNGDGLDDILWRNDAGTVMTLLGAPNGSFVGNVNSQFNPGLGWHIVGSGDFNGDGFDDILWRNDNGAITDYLGQANGSFVSNTANLNLNPGTGWHVVSVGDFNGDHIDDIMLRNSAGQTIDWLGQTNGSFVNNSAVFNFNPGTDWHVQDPFVHDPFA